MAMFRCSDLCFGSTRRADQAFGSPNLRPKACRYPAGYLRFDGCFDSVVVEGIGVEDVSAHLWRFVPHRATGGARGAQIATLAETEEPTNVPNRALVAKSSRGARSLLYLLRLPLRTMTQERESPMLTRKFARLAALLSFASTGLAGAWSCAQSGTQESVYSPSEDSGNTATSSSGGGSSSGSSSGSTADDGGGGGSSGGSSSGGSGLSGSGSGGGTDGGGPARSRPPADCL